MKKLVIAIALFCGLVAPGVASASPKHTIKMAMRPYKAIGHVAKLSVGDIVKVAGVVANFDFTAFDAAVIDPLGVAVQAFADGVDMFIAQPLESLPQPFKVAGKGVHVVYRGVDKVGQQLAK